MSSLNSCRLLYDSPAAGPWLMAVDETLLESAAELAQATLRFYRWDAPTLSLGYFQAHAQRSRHPASVNRPLVRRQTGGGAILHDRELTYSLALPSEHRLTRDPVALYRAVHEAIVGALALFGVTTRFAGSAIRVPSEEPFLCFERRSAEDLLCGEAKVCGSAQRRRRGAILQHGSILLGRSDHAAELPGILELTGRNIGGDELAESLAGQLAEGLRLEMPVAGLTNREVRAARELSATKYGADAWSLRR